jgi:hypothetical protein
MGLDDQTVLASGLERLMGPDVDAVRLPGTHGLPMERPVEVAQVILHGGNMRVLRAL